MTEQHEFFKEWCTPSPNTYRIHLSHTDLDGYACQIVSAVLDTIYEMFNTRVNAIHNCNCNYSTEEQLRTVNEALHAVHSTLYPIKGKKFLFLVSDLSQFDPEAIFGPYIRKGYDISWYVIDHHQYRNPEWIRKLDATPGCGYYVDTGYSAAVLCFRLLTDYNWLHLDSTRGLVRCEYVVKRLLSFAQAVSMSDTGNFGRWSGCRVSDIDDALRERLIFGRYDRMGAYEDWFRYTYMRMIVQNMTANDFPSYYVFRNYLDMVDEELTILQDEYVDMAGSIDQFDGTDINDQPLEGFNRLNVFILYDYEGTNFSMLAKEWLRVNKDADILLRYDPKRREYSLRSRDDGPDCSRIAALNGGGGHPRAAGFPLKAPEKL